MRAPNLDIFQLLTEAPTERHPRLVAYAPFLVVLWLVIRFCTNSKSSERSSPRKSIEPCESGAKKTANHYSSRLNPTSDLAESKNSRLYLKLRTIMALFLLCALLVVWGYLAVAPSTHQDLGSPPRSPLAPSSVLQDVFQVYQPIPFNSSGERGCDDKVLLMDHVFGSSYGAPFVGNYEPPNCKFDTVRINLTVTSRGRQYDRLASLYLGDNEVFRTSTAEPTAHGIVWTYIKEMSHYDYIWKRPQTLIFDLGNIITDVYTGSFNASLTAHFSFENKNVTTADLILPISGRKSALKAASAFQFPSDNTSVTHTIPASASRGVVSISACGQSEEEFWWSSVFSEDTQSFENTVGDLYGYTPFREIQLYIDGILAGVVWPFPIIFTGGVTPGLWRPIVGIDAFDLREPEIDISPFLPMVQDGQLHAFEIRVTGLNVAGDGKASLSDTVGSYWVVTGNIFLYYDNPAKAQENVAYGNKPPDVEAPAPKFAVARTLIQNETQGNDSLSYSVIAERSFKATSSRYSWSQNLSFTNHGLINQQGYSQVNAQLTTGNNTLVHLVNHDHTPGSNSLSFGYPLLVNTSYGTTKSGLTIDSWVERGLDFEATGRPGISTYTLGSGSSYLHTSQSGTAGYESTAEGVSSTWGDTHQEFEVEMGGQVFQRTVSASNGTIVDDTDPQSEHTIPDSRGDLGRSSVRAILGRGPGAALR